MTTRLVGGDMSFANEVIGWVVDSTHFVPPHLCVVTSPQPSDIPSVHHVSKMTSLMDKIRSKKTFRLLMIGIRAGRFEKYPSPVSFSSFLIFYHSKNHVQTSFLDE